jgi:GMP synthase PP-ATPase subunit
MKMPPTFHILWTRAVGTVDYVKADWVKLDNEITATLRKNEQLEEEISRLNRVILSLGGHLRD